MKWKIKVSVRRGKSKSGNGGTEPSVSDILPKDPSTDRFLKPSDPTSLGSVSPGTQTIPRIRPGLLGSELVSYGSGVGFVWIDFDPTSDLTSSALTAESAICQTFSPFSKLIVRLTMAS